MARQIICDVCDATYTEGSDARQEEDRKVELNGKSLKVYLDIDSGVHSGFCRLDVCPACRIQLLGKIIEQAEE